MNCPKPGSDPAAIVEYLNAMVRESVADPRRTTALAEWDRGLQLYTGEHWLTADDGTLKRVIVNRVQNIVISLVAIQAAEDPEKEFKPRETGDKPLYYLNTLLPESSMVMQGFISQGIDPAHPLPDDVALQLKNDVQLGEAMTMQAAAAGQPPPPGVLPKDILVEVNDTTSAGAVQTVFDADWEQACGHEIYVENCLNKNVTGTQPTLYEFNDETKEHILTNIHPKQWFPDPLYTSARQMQYQIYDQPLSADEAIAKWPEFEEEIRQNEQTGVLGPAANAGYTLGAPYTQSFERNMVIVRTGWLANTRYPMSPDDAVKKRKVEVRDVLQAFPETSPQPAAANDAGEPGEGAGIEPEGGASAIPEQGSEDSDPVNAGPAQESTEDVSGLAPVANLAEQSRQAYFFTGTDTEVTPDSPQWPTELAWRKCISVSNALVYDQRAETGPLPPIAFNKNQPIPHSPYGQGEPTRLEDLQMAINRVATALVTHQAYHPFPPRLVLQSIYEELGAALKNISSKPNKLTPVDDAMAAAIGGLQNAILTLENPDIGEDAWRLLNLLLELIDREGNHSDVTQGTAPAGSSGEWVNNLQSAANQVIQGKGLYTIFYLKHLIQLFYHSIVFRKTPQDWAQALGAYPIQAIQALHDRAKRMYVDISVKVKSMSAGKETEQTYNLMAARKSGVMVSDETILSRLNVDPDVEKRRAVEAAQQQALLQPQQPKQKAAQGQEAAA